MSLSIVLKFDLIRPFPIVFFSFFHITSILFQPLKTFYLRERGKKYLTQDLESIWSFLPQQPKIASFNFYINCVVLTEIRQYRQHQCQHFHSLGFQPSFEEPIFDISKLGSFITGPSKRRKMASIYFRL